jgi:NADH dehydrogenase
VFFSALSASAHNRTRLLRAKALAEEAVRSSSLRHTVFAPSIIYAPGDRYLTLLHRMSLLPVVPMSGRGRALYQPIWAEDVADSVMAVLQRPDGSGLAAARPQPRQRYELAGPDTLSHREIVEIALRSFGRRRPVVRIPTPIVSRSLRMLEALARSKAFATWDEAELMEVSMTSRSGTADAEALGVVPKRMPAVLGAG